NPQIALARPAPAAQVQAGQPIAFAYAVSVPAGGVGSQSNVVVTDDACATPTRTGGDTNNNNILEVGETWLYACTVTLNANVQSTATATAIDGFGAQVAAVTPLFIEALPASIQLSVQQSTPSATVGSTVSYNYTVTNNGSAPLNNVTVTDS